MTTPIRHSGPAGAACTFPGGPVNSSLTARTDQTRRTVPAPLLRLAAAYRAAALDNAGAFQEFTGIHTGVPTRNGAAR
ncbi:hypothetical protein ACIPJN_29135 [Streptomyces sp. NPDC086796]|uniref:hypothetical protein n=1 Tax=Streptomyces sp. NPDC086796 TaxID=3365760 RepID=UPI0037F9E3D4